MAYKYFLLGLSMSLELVFFIILLTLGYRTLIDQSIFEFVILIGGFWAWQRAGIFLSWRPAEIKAYLNDYKETEKE